MEKVVQGTISSLGHLDTDGVYYQEPDCFEAMRDLIRFLRNDDDECRVRCICGRSNMVGKDLIPIMKTQGLNGKLFDTALRLLVNLCQPALLSMSIHAPEDKVQWHTFHKLEENLIRCKLSFADEAFFRVLSNKLENYFVTTEYEERLEEDRIVMERIIALVRYVLAISANSRDAKRTTFDLNSHDRVITALLDSGMGEVLATIAGNGRERDFHLPVMEIIALIVKEHSPADLVSAANGRSASEKAEAEAAMRQAVEREQARQAAQRSKALSGRHSRFAGSYVVKGLSAVNKENDLFVNKAVKSVDDVNFCEERKAKKRVAKNKRPFEAKDHTHVSSLDFRLRLRDFVEKTLAGSYNRMMKHTKEAAFNGHRRCEQHYFLVLRFFTEYTRVARLPSSNISQTLGKEAFHHVQIKLDEYMENCAADKKQGRMWGMRAQYALAAYKELIMIHQQLLESGSSEEREFAHSSCMHIIETEEYRDLSCSLIRRFMPGLLSKTFLRELVLATHHYLRLLEKCSKAGQIRKVKRKQKVKKARKSRGGGKSGGAWLEGELVRQHEEEGRVDGMGETQLDSTWAELVAELSEVVWGECAVGVEHTPINTLLNVDDEKHQQFAMLTIQRLLRQCEPAEAVGVYRAARGIWPTDGAFGMDGMDMEDEFNELREIFYAEMEEIAAERRVAESECERRLHGGGEEMMAGGGEMSEDEEEEEAEQRYTTKEIDFDFADYVGKYAKIEVLKWYVFLLGGFDQNAPELNKALVKMLHRVAFDLNMHSRLYQLSLFRVFQQVGRHMEALSKEQRKTSPLYELYTFGFYLLKKFFSTFETVGAKLAPEVLFWKGIRECYEIDNGYGSYENRGGPSEAQTWPEELEEEVRALHRDFVDMPEPPEGMDVLDFIENNLTRPRSRKQLLHKLRHLALDTMGCKISKISAADKMFPITELKNLIEEYRRRESDGDVMDDLVDWLRKELSPHHGDFTRQKVVKQLAYLGVAYEKKRVPRYKWSDGLKMEVCGLKEQWDEMDDDDHQLIDVVDYVVLRMSEKKPRKQVETELELLGAKVVRKEVKKRPAKVKSGNTGDGFVNDDEEEELRELSDVEGVSESEGEEKEKTVDSDDEDGDMAYIRQLAGIKEKKVVEEKDGDKEQPEQEKPKKEKREKKKAETGEKKREKKRKAIDVAAMIMNGEEGEQGEQSPSVSRDTTPMQDDGEEEKQSRQSVSQKKRRRVVDSDSDGEEEEEEEEREKSASREPSADPATAPSPARKRARVVLSDSDED